ncbi:MAG TPA: DnaD domain protein [Oscillospiraceae bacterium]|nr:DnaD domain protein [Oscillospiraceae bacterium]HPF55897.1 DnaD domain protein [Clostridiales bacterium]HPK35022.1 DnaD domain protein [Oscillospiraceae bacterium]HPR76271.1 DnaD domain protein [Oscillospiraceae bacterium]
MKFEIVDFSGGFEFLKPAAPYIQNAGALSLKILFTLLTEGGFHSDTLSSQLGCEEKELRDALVYWVDCGLFSRCGGKLTLAAVTPEPKPTLKKPLPASIAAVPIMTSDEAARRIKDSEELKFLIEQMQQCFGRLLTQNEVSQMVSVCDYSGLPIDIMILLVGYCSSVGKTSMAYIKKVAMDWGERGIVTQQQADEQLKALASQSRADEIVTKALDITGRKLVAREREYANDWVAVLGFDGEMIAEAYSQCALATGKRDFRYIDKILHTWSENGVATLEQAKIFKQNRFTKASRKKTDEAANDEFLKNALSIKDV